MSTATGPKPATLPAPEHRAAVARGQLGQALGFRDCPAALLDELVEGSVLQPLGPGEFVSRRGDAAETVPMVVAGLLESSVLYTDGSRHLAGLLMPGDFGALVCVVDGEPCMTDLLARHDSLVMNMPTPLVRRLRAREPSLVLAIERQIAFRTRLLYTRLAADPGASLKARAAGVLLTMSRLYGRTSAQTGDVELHLSQTDLADWMGLSRQRLNFALKQLQDEGLIALGYLLVRIVDTAGLEAAAAR